MMKRLPIVLTCLAMVSVWSVAQGQSLEERIRIVREQRQAEQDQQAQAAAEEDKLQIPRKLGKMMDEVAFDAVPAREVFDWWSEATDIPLVIDFAGMEIDGVNPDQAITLKLKTVPANVLLKVIMQQASPDTDLIYEVTPWYVQVMTKRQANRHTEVRVYDIADMTMEIPNFTDAPDFDLNSALSNTNSGGSSGGGGGNSSGLFNDNNKETNKAQTKTKQQRGDELADLIRNTIEPTIWAANGGDVASARYYDGKLIVNAPKYVHRQIGIPTLKAYKPGSSGSYQSPAGGTSPPKASEPFGTEDQ